MADTIIYEPKGAAREYEELAINIYRGCVHGCTYCFGPKFTHKTREDFINPDLVGPKKGFNLAKLDKEARKLAGDEREIWLSVTSDVYQPLEKELGLTRKVLQILMRNNLTATILTKGGCWGLKRDMDLLKMNPNNTWGVTLTHDNPDVSREREPLAALPEDRIESLRMAHASGIKTWVSFEPVYDPESVYRLIEVTHEFVDMYKVGKMNHEEKGKELPIDWQLFRETVEEQLQRLGKKYMLKNDLLAITDSGTGRVRGEACEIYVNEMVAELQEKGLKDAEIGRQVSAKLVEKFGGYVKPRTLAQRSTRARPKSPDDTTVSNGQPEAKVKPSVKETFGETHTRLRTADIDEIVKEISKKYDAWERAIHTLRNRCLDLKILFQEYDVVDVKTSPWFGNYLVFAGVEEILLELKPLLAKFGWDWDVSMTPPEKPEEEAKEPKLLGSISVTKESTVVRKRTKKPS